ncbi:hypothetical protein PFLUV_G00052280 [Perca fluviatilis]|uniref:Uncharacterized protein n=1 Tax=Perca fluviatilis TaxID=8168 RepID=A0A6A5FFZ8_PERFL|nr:hypothetical protein PFLUV_G00052280 [Perca fluviatilis]
MLTMTRSYHHHHHHRTAARRYHLPPCHHGKPDEEKDSVKMRSCWSTWRRLTISSCSSTRT